MIELQEITGIGQIDELGLVQFTRPILLAIDSRKNFHEFLKDLYKELKKLKGLGIEEEIKQATHYMMNTSSLGYEEGGYRSYSFVLYGPRKSL